MRDHGVTRGRVYCALFSFALTPPMTSGADLARTTLSAITPPRFCYPLWSPDARYLALSDQDRGGVFLYDTLGKTYLQITDSPSSGYAYSWSADGRLLGFKLLIPVEGRIFPLQTPVVFDVQQQELQPLHEPVARAGVPSFADDGTIAFTIGEQLHIIDPSGTPKATHALGHYANLAPISPDGTKVAFNDADDQLLLLDLTTGATRPLTADGQAHFKPVWSPDSRRLLVSTVSARMRSIDVPAGRVYELGEGTAPSWSRDGSTVLYTRIDRIDGVRVKEADVYQIHWDGTGKRRLEGEPGTHEIEASLSPDGKRIALVTLGGKLCHAPLAGISGSASEAHGQTQRTMGPATPMDGDAIPIQQFDQNSVLSVLADEPVASPQTALSTSVTLSHPVPYVHQVYDTPDDFNGHWACGATSAIMAINYYNVLAYWDVTCSWPYSHISHYGQYVSRIYTFNGVTYDIRGKDPNNRWAYGGYGYIIQNNWEDTKGHMRDYIINHGLSSSVDWSPTWSKLQAEVNNNHPFVVLNSLTTAGHYIVTIGYVENQHTAIFNDPYGNKNTPGYPSYDGAGVMYDWPGYNNGFQNLNTVHCFIYCRGDLAPTITQQPVSRSVAWCEDAAFAVAASGDGALSYQWEKDASPLTEGWHYVGATSPVLTILDATDQQAGGYRCRVSSAYGSTLSAEATLTLIGPPLAPGDLDRDGDVDQDDFGLFQVCMTGSLVHQQDPACAGALLDRDNDVDGYDTTVFLKCMSGAGVPADVYCAEP